MGIIEVIIIGIGLAMDAFAASVCKGLSIKNMNWKKGIVVGLYFGIFQGIMPLIGYILGKSFENFIIDIDHWIAFLLLGFIGVRMISEALKSLECPVGEINFKTMVPLAVATSIDALAVGVTFAFLNVNIVLAIAIIGIVTFILSIVGVKVGNIFGDRYKKKAEIFGGVILILIGIKILLEHLSII